MLSEAQGCSSYFWCKCSAALKWEVGEPFYSVASSITTIITSFLLLGSSCLKHPYSPELCLVLAVAFYWNLTPFYLVAGLEPGNSVVCSSLCWEFLFPVLLVQQGSILLWLSFNVLLKHIIIFAMFFNCAFCSLAAFRGMWERWHSLMENALLNI